MLRARRTHLGYLGEVLAAEVDDRQARRRARRVAEAKFPRLKRLADFDTGASTIPPATLAHLTSGAYLDAGEPVVMLGDSGTGKTHLLIGLGLAACEQGRRVRYATTAQLVDEEPFEAADDRALSRIVGKYGRLDLLCFDALGYVHIDPRGAELLFQVITEREERALRRDRDQPALLRMGHRLPRPPPRRCHRRPRHLQRPHPRDRHPVLPPPHKQDHHPPNPLKALGQGVGANVGTRTGGAR